MIRPLGLLDGLEVNFSGLEAGQEYQLELVGGTPANRTEPLTKVKADGKGKAMGQALGPLRQVVQADVPEDASSPVRRRLVLRHMTGNQTGEVVLESGLEKH